MNNRLLTIPIALLGLWLMVSVLVISSVDRGPGTPYLAYALLLFTVTLSVAAPFRYAGYAACIVSAAVYAGVLYLLRPIGQVMLLPALVGAMFLLGSALIAFEIAQQVDRIKLTLENEAKIIENLQLKDPDTHLMRFAYARQALKTEIQRSQRYQSKFCLLLIKLVGNEEQERRRAPAGLNSIRKEVGRILISNLRVTDVPFSSSNFGIMCPETSGEQAAIVARRIASEITRQVRLGVHVGIAEFGEDASNEDEIFRAAEGALNMAIASGEQVVKYNNQHNPAEAR